MNFRIAAYFYFENERIHTGTEVFQDKVEIGLILEDGWMKAEFLALH